MSFDLTPKIIREHRHSITIHITREGEVVVKAPRLLPMFAINQFIRAKEDWIAQKLKKFEVHPIKKKQYIEGEEFWYLGDIYKLHLTSFTQIKIVGDQLIFPKALLFRAPKELENWYKKQAQEIITRRVEFYSQKMKTAYTSLKFSDTKSKWGTCGPDNDLQFNWRLVMVPLMVLDYVVIHELVHTEEKNHGASFWRIVGRETPAFKQHRKWLNMHGHLLTF